jgi:DnaJ-class molecular chaperone
MSHYTTLGVASTATAAEIKSAYRALAKKHHPDLNPGNAASEALFKEITNAFDVLGDAEKRSKYDGEQTGFRYTGEQQQWGSSAHHGFGHSPAYDDILADIMRQRARRGAHGFSEYEGVKNRDIQLTYTITLEEAFTGKETNLKYKVGAESRDIILKVPQGIQSGMKIRHPGLGDHAAKAVPAGDLFVTIDVMPHARFVRTGNDIMVTAQIDYLQAMTGGSVDVPTIDGHTLRLKVPAGTAPGKVVRVVGRGMNTSRGRGDMFVEFGVVAPVLSNEERAKIQEIVSQRKG